MQGRPSMFDLGAGLARMHLAAPAVRRGPACRPATRQRRGAHAARPTPSARAAPRPARCSHGTCEGWRRTGAAQPVPACGACARLHRCHAMSAKRPCVYTDDLYPVLSCCFISPSLETQLPDKKVGPRRRQDADAAAGRFGFAVDNTIGGTPQPNGWLPTWVAFFRERRLLHQLRLANDGALSRMGERLAAHLDRFFEGVQARPPARVPDLVACRPRHSRRADDSAERLCHGVQLLAHASLPAYCHVRGRAPCQSCCQTVR